MSFRLTLAEVEPIICPQEPIKRTQSMSVYYIVFDLYVVLSRFLNPIDIFSREDFMKDAGLTAKVKAFFKNNVLQPR